MNEQQILMFASVSILLFIVNFPIITFLGKMKRSNCNCSHTSHIRYLYVYLLFWYAMTGIQIMAVFLTPKLFDWFANSPLYYPSIVISGVSYTFYIMSLWAYVEYLKESSCDCSNIKNKKYVMTYAWFFFLLYVVSVSYLGTIVSGIAK
jgi:hypothetical protein